MKQGKKKSRFIGIEENDLDVLNRLMVKNPPKKNLQSHEESIFRALFRIDIDM